MKQKLLLMSLILFVLYPFAENSNGQIEGIRWNCCHPKMGVVPDSETAVALAKTVLLPIYHAEFLNGEEPFSASLTDGVWTITGTAPKFEPNKIVKTPSGTGVTVISKEGPLQVTLSQWDGRILRCCFPEAKTLR